ncbi:MAG: PIG-L family deacetylase [Candidatus Krumholzibacteria bacterium]|nr:PIG-L family deacetylase [Candidatus Krumholzibacteria bacterium]
MRTQGDEASRASAAVIVAHPDDEVLWAGGAILSRPAWEWTIVTLCRRDDPDRAPRFRRVLERLGAGGAMDDLDDGPDQTPLDERAVEESVQALVGDRRWDVVFTHSPFGEYTRHRRHEEVSRAVTALWTSGALRADELRLFAYEDGQRRYLPRAIEGAHEVVRLNQATWRAKRGLIQDLYGFASDSWEARVTPRTEAFWRFATPGDYRTWLRSHQPHTPGGEK